MQLNIEDYKSNLTIVLDKSSSKHGQMNAIYRCYCGNEFETRKQSVKSGKTVSCGCYGKRKQVTHNLTNHPIYKTWDGMRRRCLDSKNLSYKNYGGRGITICDEWRDSPILFIEWAENNGWEKGLEIDRKVNDSGYSPSNCRFVTPKVNSNNRRSNVIVLFNGEMQNVKQLCERMNLKYRLVIQRIEKGWPIEKAILPPLMQKGINKKEIEREIKRQNKRKVNGR